MTESSKIYSYHVANLAAIDQALDQTASSLRISIRICNLKQTKYFTCLFAMLLGAWAEVRLLKLLNEINAFNDSQTRKILQKPSLYLQWQEAVKISFEVKYCTGGQYMPATARLRYQEIKNLMDVHLKPVIELRNKLAHGQWAFPLNSKNTDLAADAMRALKQQNLLNLQFKKQLLELISFMINDLALSKPTFERDFDNHFRRVDEVQRNLSNRSYTDYCNVLICRYKKGLVKRRVNEADVGANTSGVTSRPVCTAG